MGFASEISERVGGTPKFFLHLLISSEHIYLQGTDYFVRVMRKYLQSLWILVQVLENVESQEKLGPAKEEVEKLEKEYQDLQDQVRQERERRGRREPGGDRFTGPAWFCLTILYNWF